MRNLKTKSVIIRRFEKEDTDRLYEIFNNNNKIINISNFTINGSKVEMKMIINSAIMEYHTEETIWALEEKNTKELFGFIKIDNYSPKNKMCKISWATLESNKNELLITQALKKVMNYLFNKKDIELIECSYYGQSKEPGEILNNIGMKKEAVLKHRRFNENTKKKEDFIIYSIDINDFKELKLCNA